MWLVTVGRDVSQLIVNPLIEKVSNIQVLLILGLLGQIQDVISLKRHLVKGALHQFIPEKCIYVVTSLNQIIGKILLVSPGFDVRLHCI